MSSSSVLVKLYNNKKLVTKVDNLLDEGQTYEYVVEFCKENGLDISKASLTNYKKKRQESIETGKPLLQLLDKRAKDNITYITDKEVSAFKKKKETRVNEIAIHEPPVLDRVDKVYSDLEFLDEIISKGMKGLKSFDVVDTPLALKAVELRAKITGNQLNGLSLAGLREIKVRMMAKESALTEIIMKYVPEEKHDQLFADLDEAERLFYDNLDLTEEDRRISESLRKSGISDF